jgi:GH43 family beta-xylosidase
VKFYIRHADGRLEFEANSKKYGREKARKIVQKNGLENAELFVWEQHWKGDPSAGRENNYLSLSWEGWQHEAYVS